MRVRGHAEAMNRPLGYAMLFPLWVTHNPREAHSDVLVHARECAILSCLVVLILSAQLQRFELHHPEVWREIMLSTERYRVTNGWQSIFELRSDEGGYCPADVTSLVLF